MNILTRGCILQFLLEYAILSLKLLIWAEKSYFIFMQCYMHEQITDKYNQIKMGGGCTMVQGCF